MASLPARKTHLFLFLLESFKMCCQGWIIAFPHIRGSRAVYLLRMTLRQKNPIMGCSLMIYSVFRRNAPIFELGWRPSLFIPNDKLSRALTQHNPTERWLMAQMYYPDEEFPWSKLCLVAQTRSTLSYFDFGWIIFTKSLELIWSNLLDLFCDQKTLMILTKSFFIKRLFVSNFTTF